MNGIALDGIRQSGPAPRRPQPRLLARSRMAGAVVAALFMAMIAGGTAVAVGPDVAALASLKAAVPPGHYLVLFQNNAELRASGGFIGSFAVVDVGQYGVERYVVDTNIYKRDAAFTQQNDIAMPAPMAGLAPELAMRDANFDLDFRDAARRVAWFYAQEGGERVDGVIAVNASVVQDLLRLTGPVAVQGLQQPLDADGFFTVLATAIERDYFADPARQAANEPKSLLLDLARALVRRLADPTVAVRLPRLLRQELAEKQLVLFHADPAVEAAVVAHGWGGAVADTAGDYLFINNELVAGSKSSLFVGQDAQLAVTRSDDGSYRHVLTLRRTHAGTGAWPDGKNTNYVRVAVPQGSVLESARLNGQALDAVDRTTEAGKSIFGTRMDTDPGQTSTLQLTYTVPSLPAPYALHIQKQPGVLVERYGVSLDGRPLFSGDAVSDTLVAAD